MPFRLISYSPYQPTGPSELALAQGPSFFSTDEVNVIPTNSVCTELDVSCVDDLIIVIDYDLS